MAKLEASRRTPNKVQMLPRERIRIKRRCNLCGGARAVYRKPGSDAEDGDLDSRQLDLAAATTSAVPYLFNMFFRPKRPQP